MSDNDVRILEGLAAYVAVHSAVPERSQLHAALENIDLDKAEFTVVEIYEKVRRLRNKYFKLRDGGRPPVPGNGEDGGDEVRRYELSTKIWGNQPANVVAKKRGSARAAAAVAPPPEAGRAIPGARRGVEELQALFPCLAAEVEKLSDDDMLAPVLNRAFQFIDDQKASELEAKAKKQKLAEAKMTLDRTILRNKVLELLMRSTD